MDTNINAKGKGLFWRFVAGINKVLNPDHAWTDYQSKDNTLLGDLSEYVIGDLQNQGESLVNKFTDAHATQGEIERNEMQMQNVEDTYQRQVAGMQKAGLNPAMMYQSGASGSAPSVSTSGSGAGMNMSDLMELFLLPTKKKALEADISNTEAKTDRERQDIKESEARTENINLINKYYPEMREAELDEIAASVGVKLSEIGRISLENELTKVKTAIADSERKFADRMNQAKLDYENAKTDEAKQSAAESFARAAMESFELKYAKENNAKLSSSSILALASAISSALGLDLGSDADPGVLQVIGNTLNEKSKDAAELLTHPAEHVKKKGRQIDQKLDKLRHRPRPGGSR